MFGIFVHVVQDDLTQSYWKLVAHGAPLEMSSSLGVGGDTPQLRAAAAAAAAAAMSR